MSHLKDVKLSYLGHFVQAITYAWQLFKIVLILIVHSILPEVYQKVASTRLRQLVFEISNAPKNKILVRFNTKFAEDEKKRIWRVLVNGQERLAKKIYIYSYGETHEEEVDGTPKYHVMYYGYCTWDGDKAYII